MSRSRKGRVLTSPPTHRIWRTHRSRFKKGPFVQRNFPIPSEMKKKEGKYHVQEKEEYSYLLKGRITPARNHIVHILTQVSEGGQTDTISLNTIITGFRGLRG